MTTQAAQTLGSTQVHPELAQKMASYIKETDELVTELRTENSQLKAENSQKTASEGVVEDGRITEVVEHLVQAGFLKESSRDQAIASVTENPATALLDFVDKLAAQRITPPGRLPSLGKPIDRPGSPSDVAPNSAEKRASDKAFEQTFDHPST